MKVALVGNPNSGKSTLFNYLTGLRQKTGNYAGVTVEKKTGRIKESLTQGEHIELVDLPGLYSLYPKTPDEKVALDVLSHSEHPEHPDLTIMVADASNLERNLLLYTQLLDFGLPVLLALNMSDIVRKKGLLIDQEKLKEVFGGTEVVSINARTGEGVKDLLRHVLNGIKNRQHLFIPEEFCNGLTQNPDERQANTELRYKQIGKALKFVLKHSASNKYQNRQRKLDKVLTHPVWGYAIFLGILLVMFQAIYAWAEWPMNLIDQVFFGLSGWLKEVLPVGVFTDLIAEGIVPGLGGVIIFVPQITLLFFFLFLLEESGYMSRVVFILDRLMRPFGLNGRSAVPLVTGIACAIPAVMATRTIENRKERLNTILVTPLMSCSARLPVYTLLIALVVPDDTLGFFNVKGLVLMGLYLLGLVAALLAAMVFKWILKTAHHSFLVMELPAYRMPRWNNLGITLWEKVRLFIFEAGKVILAISVILWVLASYGPGDRMAHAAENTERAVDMTDQQYEARLNAVRLSNSYIGLLGQAIEPAIKPLGYDWQIGIALITSFAAREVFVGSMATIYSVGGDFEMEQSLLQRMRGQRTPDGMPVYTLATGISLMIFYAFAMQCMSTLAVVLRETKSWKWPLIQLLYMTGLAYLAALLAYQLLK